MNKFLISALICVLSTALPGQDPSPFDFGKMWTFENPPREWFEEAYDFNPDDAWFEYVRKSSLKFATWCSASFVSPDGLVMTNHHCSRGELEKVQRPGENLDEDGFYAPTKEEERKAGGLFVEQLWKFADITSRVKAVVANVDTDADRAARIEQTLQDIQEEYAEKEEWQDLRLQVVTFHSGGAYSIYGLKRYDDVRLVFIPELDLGYFGGDPDNFTYPRYNLDFTFWRVYDDNGEPLDTRRNFFKFNPDGVNENTPVFVIGNPGSTERYRTVAQLRYDRDYRYPVIITFLENRLQLMEEEYAGNPSFQLQENILSYRNSIKAFKGFLRGLQNDVLFERKVAMEEYIREHSPHDSYWDRIAEIHAAIGPARPELQFLSPSVSNNGVTITLLHEIFQYLYTARDNPEDENLPALGKSIAESADALDTKDERRMFAMVLRELEQFADPEDTYIAEILDGRTPEKAAGEILDETFFSREKKAARLLKKPEKALKREDPLFEIAETLVFEFYDAAQVFHSTSEEIGVLEEKIAHEVFNVLGDDLPPEATFTLRISDGEVKRYPYNGTIAPYKTTFYGLYDRYYSNDGQDPWDLPARWQNPPAGLLKSPLNFISTNDTAGGSSGSPVINTDKEVVGVSFDGNIESLPGNFIYDTQVNRSVSVHAGGIIASLKYIYGADGLVEELVPGP